MTYNIRRDVPSGSRPIREELQYYFGVAASDYLENTALSVFETKDALLYFKHVIPLTYTFDVLNDSLRSHKLASSWSFVEHGSVALGNFVEYARSYVIPSELRRDDFYEAMKAIGEGHLSVLFSRYWQSEANQTPDNVELVANDLIGPATRLLKCFSIAQLPAVLPAELMSLAPVNDGDISLSLASLKLVDTQRTRLPQIYEFRRDQEAVQKFRKLRTFLYENYRDKPRAYVEDDLLARIHDYDEAVKKWGFETKVSILTALLDSKLIAGGIAGSFLSSYLNSPLLTIAAGLGTAGLTIGKIAVQLGRQRSACREALANNPISYIAYAKEKLEQ